MANTAVLVATERRLGKRHQILVHRESSNLETRCELVSHFQIAGPDSPVKSVVCLIGHGNNFVEAVGLGNAQDGSEDLVAPDFHLPVDVLEDCGLDAISLL